MLPRLDLPLWSPSTVLAALLFAPVAVVAFVLVTPPACVVWAYGRARRAWRGRR